MEFCAHLDYFPKLLSGKLATLVRISTERNESFNSVGFIISLRGGSFLGLDDFQKLGKLNLPTAVVVHLGDHLKDFRV